LDVRSVQSFREGLRQTAVITGASSGIGASFARRLAVDGWNLVLVARREQRLADLARDLEGAGVATEMVVADLAEPGDLAQVMARSAAQDVRLLINCAGINGFGPAGEVDQALLRRVIAVNVTAPTLLVRAALPGMLARGDGFIINVASRLALASAIPPGGGMPHRSVYAASKAFVVTFTRTLESELAETAVQVQALCPPLTATEFHLTDGTTTVSDNATAVSAPGMTPDGVVAASLLALAAGETICLPSLEDSARVTDYISAEAALRDAAAGPLARRFGGP
jgi:short-subunit dehydrogenase